MSNALRPGDQFDATYYSRGCGEPYQRSAVWLDMFDHIARVINQTISPAITLDAGCAMGFLVEGLRKLGVKAWGVDLSSYAISQVHESIKPYCSVGSVAEPFGRRYDLITCIEVLEHMPQAESERAVANICAHADDVLFSSSADDFDEPTHINVQPAEYWAELFARQGFFRDPGYDVGFISPWAVRFRRALTKDPLIHAVRSYEKLVAEQKIKLAELAKVRAESAVLQTRLSQTETERLRLADLVSGYQNGRLMRFMSWVNRLRTPTAQPEVVAPAAGPAERPLTPYQRWAAEHTPDEAELAAQRANAGGFQVRPKISFVVPVFDPPVDVLRWMIQSVEAQTYDNWQLCLADGGSTDPQVLTVLREAAAREARVSLVELTANGGISANSNAALALADGDYVALLDHDDIVSPNMLFEVVSALNADPGADIVYFDEDKISADGSERMEPTFKPGSWAPEQMLSANYLMHSVIRRKLIEDVGRFDPAMDGAQDWDLLLRCSEKTGRIVHVPRVLYHWRKLPTSAATSLAAKPWAVSVQPRVIERHFQRTGPPGTKVQMLAPGQFHVTWPVSNRLVSIIIPTKDNLSMLTRCLQSVLALTDYPAFEVLLVDTGSADPRVLEHARYVAQRDPRVRLLQFEHQFNYSAVNNFAVKQARGDLLLFLNDDVEVLNGEAGWLTELAMWAERPGVGAAGAKLLYPDGHIQHAGVVVGLGHVYNDAEERFIESYFGGPGWYRNYSAVTGACMMMRRDVFDSVGGFDEGFELAFGDVDLCLRLHAKGFRHVYTPYARLRHYEGSTRANRVPAADTERFAERLSALPLSGRTDFYYNPNLTLARRIPGI